MFGKMISFYSGFTKTRFILSTFDALQGGTNGSKIRQKAKPEPDKLLAILIFDSNKQSPNRLPDRALHRNVALWNPLCDKAG